jgi:hypothetical protein
MNIRFLRFSIFILLSKLCTYWIVRIFQIQLKPRTSIDNIVTTFYIADRLLILPFLVITIVFILKRNRNNADFHHIFIGILAMFLMSCLIYFSILDIINCHF